jgi:hypothetical protein
MSWNKLGLVFDVPGKADWIKSHAWVPTPDKLEGDLYKVYFAGRNADNLSQIGHFVIDITAPNNIVEVSQKPDLELGELGTFDDSAVIPSWIVDHEGTKYMYYIGWTQGRRVPYFSNIGLAISEDGGATYSKYSQGPLVDRNDVDPYMTASPCVRIENGIWRLWYLSNTQWTPGSEGPMPRYHIKYAESTDGINWRREGTVCIDFKNDEEYAIARPCVIHEDGKYKMWYSYRGDSYRIGYAESNDGIKWERQDEQAGIDVSPAGWDSEMIEYAYVFSHNDADYMLYNGNNYGYEGIGLAIAE